MTSKVFSITAGIIIPLAGVIAAVTVPELRCLSGLDKSQCVQASQSTSKVDVDIQVKTDNYQPVAEAEIEFASQGPPERVTTDSNGYARIRIPSTADVRITLVKPGFQTRNYSIDLRKDTVTTRTFHIPSNSKEVTPTPIPPTPTPIPPTPTPTPSSISLKDSPPSGSAGAKTTSKTPQGTRVEPEKFIESYFEKINDKNLPDAWKLLSSDFQNDGKGGYPSFTKWWGETVQKVTVKSVETIEKSENYTKVRVMLQYRINGKVSDEDPLYYVLRWDSKSNNWLIYRK
jgi:hypothetical protein